MPKKPHYDLKAFSVFSYTEQRATRMQVNRSVLDLLEKKLTGIIDNEAKKLDNESRKIALQERAMAMQEKEKGNTKNAEPQAGPSNVRQQGQQNVVQAAGPGGEPRLMTQLQPAAFDMANDAYPFRL